MMHSFCGGPYNTRTSVRLPGRRHRDAKHDLNDRDYLFFSIAHAFGLKCGMGEVHFNGLLGEQ